MHPRVGDKPATVRVRYDGDPGWRSHIQPREELVTGDADELFLGALARTFGLPPEFNSCSLVVRDPDGDADGPWVGIIDERVTLGGAAHLAGGATLEVDVQGRGGGFIPFMWELVESGLTLAGIFQAGQTTLAVAESVRFRRYRAYAERWVDAGTDTEPELELVQSVRNFPEWERSRFDRAFGLDREAGSSLLRRLGYARRSGSPEVWVEPANG